MIDAVNVVDIIVYQYWDNKIRVYRALSKTSGNPVTKPKKKKKRLVKYETCKIWNQFFSLIVSCCFNWGQYIPLYTLSH